MGQGLWAGVGARRCRVKGVGFIVSGYIFGFRFESLGLKSGFRVQGQDSGSGRTVEVPFEGVGIKFGFRA